MPLVVVNRTLERAEELARELGDAVAMSLDEFRARPPRVEALLAATGAPEAVARPRPASSGSRRAAPSGEPPLVVDLAVPPDVEPAAARAAGMPRIGMDEINRAADAAALAPPGRDRGGARAGRRGARRAAPPARRARAAPVLARLNQRYRETAARGRRTAARQGGRRRSTPASARRSSAGPRRSPAASRTCRRSACAASRASSESRRSARFLAAADQELFREFSDVAGALDPLADRSETLEHGDPPMSAACRPPGASDRPAGPQSRALFERARRVIPGGVNSPVRAFRAVGGTPLFVARGEGAQFEDVDGRRYLDFVGSWGPLILGHAHPEVLAAVAAAAGARHHLRRALRRRGRARRGDRRRATRGSSRCASSPRAPRRR